MNNPVTSEDVLGVIKQFYLLNEADEATTDIILAICAEILGISPDTVLEKITET